MSWPRVKERDRKVTALGEWLGHIPSRDPKLWKSQAWALPSYFRASYQRASSTRFQSPSLS